MMQMNGDTKTSALQTIVRLMRKKAASRFMGKLRPGKGSKRSVKDIVSSTVSAGDMDHDGDMK